VEKEESVHFVVTTTFAVEKNWVTLATMAIVQREQFKPLD